jgi:dihydroorotate dehydrogenase
MYKSIFRPFLFLFDPEKIHQWVFFWFKFFQKMPFLLVIIRRWYQVQRPELGKDIMGLHFSNPVGLAAGFDKNAEVTDVFDAFGFGFVEIGTLTPYTQPGNPKKRIFRLPPDQALINRMGFNNMGVTAAVKHLKRRKSKVIVGGNIGKNKNTPNENAISDYIAAFNELFNYVDYFVVNVSSPNTPHLRDLQEKEPLTQLLLALQTQNNEKSHPKPILLKIAPDLTDLQLLDIIEIVQLTQIQGVVATNTTLSRAGLRSDKTMLDQIGAGGLSGSPLKERSTEVIKFLANKSNKSFTIIGVGGIHSPEDAKEKLKAGADLVQLYTGFIYEGPGLVKHILQEL